MKAEEDSDLEQGVITIMLLGFHLETIVLTGWWNADRYCQISSRIVCLALWRQAKGSGTIESTL